MRLARGMALAVLLLLSLGLPAAAAQTELTAENLGLSVDVGFEGRHVPGAMIPITIGVTPTDLFDGVVEVTSSTQTVERIPLEVTAGATKRLHVLAPSDAPPSISIIPNTGEPLVLRPRDESTSVALVGFVGGVPARLPQVDDSVTGRPVVPVEVDPVWLPRGAPALESLTTLVIDAASLATLAHEARAGLAEAVVNGLDLVVTVTASDDPGLGLPWSPITALSDGGPTSPAQAELAAITPAESARAIADASTSRVIGAAQTVGRGRVTALGFEPGSVGVGRDAAVWEPLLSTGPRGRTDMLREETLVGSSSLRLPSVGMMTLFLLTYVIAIGPVTGFALSRMRRTELAWVVVPAVTLVFSGAAFFLASAAQPSVALASRTLHWVDGAGTETIDVVLRAPRQGTHHVSFGGDWVVTNAAFGNSPRVGRQPGATNATVELEALAVASLEAQRPLAEAPPLVVTARLDGDQLEFEVTNESDTPFEHLMFLAGNELLAIDEPVAPGETIEMSLLPTAGMMWQGWQEQGWQLDSEHPFRALLVNGTLGVTPTTGMVHVVGHASSGLASSEVLANGERPADEGTNVVVSVWPELGDDVPAWAMQRSVRTTGWVHDLGRWVDAPADEIVIRYRVPNGAVTSGTLALENDGRFGQVDPGIGQEVCRQVEERDEQGNLLSVQEVCELVGDGPLDFVCPPDAVSCEVNEFGFEVCFPNGVCEGGDIAGPLPDQPGQAAVGASMQAWDWSASSWVPLQVALAEGAADRFVSATGEFRLRPGELGGEAGTIPISLRSTT